MSDVQPGSKTIGTTADIVARLRAVIPGAWFPLTAPDASVSATPVLDGLLEGVGWAWSYCYALMSFVIEQARIATASGSFLDMICADFFGLTIQRKSGEADDTFRNRLRANLLLPRATRGALTMTIAALVDETPIIIEPRNGVDTGGYGSYSVPNAGGGGGYGTSALALGSANMPFQFLLSVSSQPTRTARESQATFIDATGALQIAERHVVRPSYSGGSSSGSLAEARGFNLIKDSIGWTSWTQSSENAVGRWAIDPAGADALWAGAPTLRINVYSGGQVVGPSVTASATGDQATASLWLFLPTSHSFQSLGLEICNVTAPASVVTGSADLTLGGKWQRLTATTPAVTDSSRNISMTLVGVSTALMNEPVVTQCWQLETGSIATSYIPSSQQVGIREADNLIAVSSATAMTVDQRSLNEAIGRVIPAGSIAWTTIPG